MSELVAHPGPDWVVAEMPAGYQNRLEEIRRLTADLQEMGRFARLLYETGPTLAEAVQDAFVALKLEPELAPGASSAVITAKLDARRRLLLLPAATTAPVQRKSAELAEVFQMVQDVADDTDRVVLVTNVDPDRPPPERVAPLTSDAHALLARLAASHVTGPTLFNIWKLSLQGLDRARAQVERLHAQEPGTFELPASLLR